ncbi:hypothetical protein DAEQUDRAFT_679571 [Daedalea quercina L-15889]|uniref:Uncharacterized protein n=1 Tax=Daedalea quercina L-15889 TaxID=1314783 RepID=A0A165L3H8_9APHY|nr:hypothetical protein DAEQUDRAFT_679571 [Daedalea quercina L-15889]
MSASDVYAQQLFRLGYGYPLWDPQTPRGEVYVGDVGFIDEGSFHRVFNATNPEDHPANKYGVPSGYKPFTLTSEFSSYKKPGALAPGALCSRTIKQLSVGMAASSHGFGAGLEFQCTDNQGAVLVIQHGANRERILPSRRMVHYMSQNFASWHEFITHRLDVDIPKDSIQFISGVHKTSHWAVASYVEAGRTARFQFNADLTAASAAFSASAKSQVYSAPMQNWGPKDDIGNPPTTAASQVIVNDQSVFIHYYKLKRRLLFLPQRVMKAAAGYDNLPPRPDDDADEGGASVELTSSAEEVNEFEPDKPSFQVYLSVT